jgi:class 3 adenylate cyclase
VFEGVLVLLVTDLQDFTVWVERLGDREARALMRSHNLLLRACVRQRGGIEVTHTGDGIIAAFRSVCAALHCAQEIQRDLSAHAPRSGALRARIGMHAGEPLHEDGRLFGCCVNTAVRVCNLAQAQHILVTGVVRQLACGAGFDFPTSSVVKLKGCQADIEVHELGLLQ